MFPTSTFVTLFTIEFIFAIIFEARSGNVFCTIKINATATTNTVTINVNDPVFSPMLVSPPFNQTKKNVLNEKLKNMKLVLLFDRFWRHTNNR